MFLLIDKPAGPTSHDIVDAVRRITGEKRVGHAGTLDPFATGLLIVGVGRESTKRLAEFLGQDKAYEAGMVLGCSSDTQDFSGTLTPVLPDGPWPAEAAVKEAMQRFIGPILQIPPMFSAKKMGGKKLYELARAGHTIERPPAEVTVHSFELLSYSPPRAAVSVRCSSGTYVRTLAHDLGAALGTGAYLQTLRRTAIGSIAVAQAVALAALTPQNWREHAQTL